MKLISYQRDGRSHFGAVTDTGIIELTDRLDGVVDLVGLLGDKRLLALARKTIDAGTASYPLSDVELEPVIPRPGKVICVGINFTDHAAEAGRKIGQYPVIFQRYNETLIAHGAPLVRPKVSTHFDFEAELAVVIGKGGAHIDPADAMDHVAGYTCFNDASVRDWQFHTHQYGMGKNFRATAALGPWLVTADDIPDYRELTVTGVLNGAQVQEGRLASLAFDIPMLIAYVSQALTWNPGDILATGTPSGVGFKRTPPLFLKAGDRFEVIISQIGTLSNPVVDEA